MAPPDRSSVTIAMPMYDWTKEEIRHAFAKARPDVAVIFEGESRYMNRPTITEVSYCGKGEQFMIGHAEAIMRSIVR